ncbi:MAG: hypothetical protein OXG81_09080 [Acidobacteria bacterium]|nr:hypothetical protein [Acidobacteriota bacterium]
MLCKVLGTGRRRTASRSSVEGGTIVSDTAFAPRKPFLSLSVTCAKSAGLSPLSTPGVLDGHESRRVGLKNDPRIQEHRAMEGWRRQQTGGASQQ